MREYKLVYPNKGLSMSREKDIEKAEKLINEMSEQGWTLQQVVTPGDGVGAMVGVFYKEHKL
ncbi:MAG: DUF4177 domain-containing protein [Clostridia bacterium]|nr:DUF4177 domain-containing protein [Clostridia bacterium]